MVLLEGSDSDRVDGVSAEALVDHVGDLVNGTACGDAADVVLHAFRVDRAPAFGLAALRPGLQAVIVFVAVHHGLGEAGAHFLVGQLCELLAGAALYIGRDEVVDLRRVSIGHFSPPA